MALESPSFSCDSTREQSTVIRLDQVEVRINGPMTVSPFVRKKNVGRSTRRKCRLSCDD